MHFFKFNSKRIPFSLKSAFHSKPLRLAERKTGQPERLESYRYHFSALDSSECDLNDFPNPCRYNFPNMLSSNSQLNLSFI